MLNYSQTFQAVAACLQAKVTALVLGSPGVGKSSLAYALGKAIGKPAHILIGSNLDPTDIAGFPYVGPDGKLHRAFLPAIQACIDTPGILVCDEATATAPSVRPPFMRLALERIAGDTPLHSESSVLLLANRPEEAPGGTEMTAMEVNRTIKLSLFPSLDEIRAYFAGRPTVPVESTEWEQAKYESILTSERLDFALTLGVEPTLLQMTPPPPSIDAAEPWSSPRGVDLSLKAGAAHITMGGAMEDDVGYALVSGGMGEGTAARYLGIRRLRNDLPSVDDVREEPLKALVPDARDKQIAALGLVGRVAEKDIWASWLYTERLAEEVRMGCARVLHELPQVGLPRWQEEGRKAKIRILGKITRKLQGR